MTPWLNFKDESCRQAVLDWWSGLVEDRGGRAELRRCRSAGEVIFCPAFHRLRLALLRHGPVQDERLAGVAGVLAHLDQDAPEATSLAELMARPRAEGGQARVSGLRFRRLLRVEDRRELYPDLVRVLRLLDRRGPVASLAADVYGWSDLVRKMWALKYYELAPTAD